MKLLFSGMVVATKLLEAIRESGFELASSENRADLIAVPVKDAKAIAKLESTRAAHPKVWIVAVVSLNTLNEPTFYEKMLRAAPDDLWLAESWEATLWFALQRALRIRRLESALDLRARAEAELRSSSEQLVRQLEKQIRAVGEIQRSLLPAFAPEIPGVSVVAKYVPASGPGGDYYDLFELGDRRRFGVLLADSRNHGTVASLLAALLKIRSDEMGARFTASASFVDHLISEVAATEGHTDPLSLLYGVFDRAGLTFEFTQVGDLIPLLWRAGTSCAPPDAPGPVQRTRHWNLKPGDRLVFATDGIRPILKKENGGDGDLSAFLERFADAEPLDFQNEILGLIKKQGGAPQLEDDLTLLQFVVNPRALYVAPN